VAEQFAKQFHVRWGDMDFNAHMSNTAYLDVSADVRMMYFQEHGFPMREFERLRVGPVITRDELEYFRELRGFSNPLPLP
jgi:acyl-CoA thioester hydrolase